MTLRRLAELAIGGNLEAYAELVTRYRERLFATAFLRLGNRDEALDAVQDAVIAGTRSVAGLRDPRAFARWMDRLLSRACSARLRGPARREESTGDAPENAVRDADPCLRLWLDEVLAALPARHREVLWSFYYSGMSVRELAAAVGRPEGTVKRWLSEARLAAQRRSIAMAGTVCVVGADLSAEERCQIQSAAAELSLECRHADDVWKAHKAMGEEPPALAVVAKRMDGPCDAFLLVAMLRRGREPDLSAVPIILLGPGERNYAFAAWCAEVECYLARPFATDELRKFMALVLEAMRSR